jgi:hypothetical protein
VPPARADRLRRSWRIVAVLYLLTGASLPLFLLFDALLDFGPRGLAWAQDFGAEVAFAWLLIVLPAYALLSLAWISRAEPQPGGRFEKGLTAGAVGAAGLLLGAFSVIAAL